MARIDIIAIEEEARRLRAEDLRRGEPVFAARTGLYLSLLAGTLLEATALAGESLRWLFSWNPQAHGPRAC